MMKHLAEPLACYSSLSAPGSTSRRDRGNALKVWVGSSAPAKDHLSSAEEIPPPVSRFWSSARTFIRLHCPMSLRGLMHLISKESRPGRSLLVGLDHGAEMIGQIADMARDIKIKAAAFSAIGALCRADLGFYDQAGREYRIKAVEEPVEIASCSGNISLLDGQPFVHAHAVLSASSGCIYAGHLVRASIFAAELFLQELPEAELDRMPDPQTGLKLWGEKRKMSDR